MKWIVWFWCKLFGGEWTHILVFWRVEGGETNSAENLSRASGKCRPELCDLCCLPDESQMMICRGISLKGCRKLELSSANEEGREMKMESKGEEDVLVTALEPPAYRVNFLALYFKWGESSWPLFSDLREALKMGTVRLSKCKLWLQQAYL